MSEIRLTPEEMFDEHADCQFEDEHNELERAITKDAFCEIIREYETEREKLLDCIKIELDIIKNLISGKRIVNLDESIAHYESILKTK